jgi:long-chain acyl-CoA synthetase
MKELVYHRHLLPAVERFGSKVAFHDTADGSTATFDDHLDRVLRLGSALTGDLGVGRGDRFAVMALNGRPYLELWHAAYLGCGVINPLNLRLAPKELGFILGDSDTKVCFVDFLFAGLIDQVRKEAGIETVVLIGDDMGTGAPHDVKYADLLTAGKPVVPDEPEEEDPVVLMYTGGTTGLPKGVLCDQRAELLNMYHIAMVVGLKEEHVYLHQTPMFHAASMGAILGIPACGAASVFVPAFEPKAVIEAIEKYGVTWSTMVPTMIGMVVNHPEFRPERLASMTDIAYGASPMPMALLESLMSMYPELRLVQGYGMTEASSMLTALLPNDHAAGGDRLRSVGRGVPGVMLSIQDAEGNVLPPGETGEVCARGGNYMREYWKRPKETEEAFRGGWYHTGDAGYLDESGYLFLVDRVKDMIVTGGENVYSVEVENAIAAHPAVLQVAVIGIPSEQWGEAVHAIVVLKDGASATEAEIIDHARDAIAGYKLPKSVDFRTEPLPLSGAMKVLKKDLRAPYWEGRDKAVN